PDLERFQAVDVPLAWMESAPFPPIHETGELLRKWQPSMTVLQISTDHHFFPVTASEETAEIIDGWIKSQGTTD
ncbi:MAG: hypothetical protein KY455_08290, partial [Euryarchaeota archaeon]|nr:hypothetical protein [Euryarchaeota archaeon]